MTIIEESNPTTVAEPQPEDTNEEAALPVPATRRLPAPRREGSLDDAVAHINGIVARRGMEVALEVGRYLLDRFYDGNPALVRDRGKKQPGFRDLVGRGDLAVGHVWLWRAVRVSIQLPFLPDEAATRLSLTHHAALLPIRMRRTKYELAEQAIEEQMTTRELKDAVAEALWLERPVNKRGPKPIRRREPPTFLKTVRRLSELVDEEGRWHDLDKAGRLKLEDAVALRKTILRIEARCVDVRAALRGKPDV